MIRVEAAPGSLLLRGHAGTAPQGADLVCAAVSILAETLARQLPEGAALLAPGRAEFHFGENNPAAAFVLAGLELLARHCPQAVTVTWVHSHCVS